ncbi:MAG: hypothetical protein M0R22_00485 [Dehalococcoidia bacterium]|nr:hypothetical protein [Dehalococcoidia bacterium]
MRELLTADHPALWFLRFMWVVILAAWLGWLSGCGDPYADADVDEYVCNEMCLDPDETAPNHCTCGRLIEEFPFTQPGVTTCLCSCNPDLERAETWCADPF